MRRFVDCHAAVVPWGARAYFKRARVGLMRKGTTVYIAIFFGFSDKKFPIQPTSIEILPAAIRLKDQSKDLFIRQVSDEQRYNDMMREIKILLKKDRLMQKGKADALEKFISEFPPFDLYNPRELAPAPSSARLIGSFISKQSQQQRATSVPDDELNVEANSNNTNYTTIAGQGRPSNNCVGNNAPVNVRCQQLNNKQLRKIRIIGFEKVPKQVWERNSLHELTLTNCNLTYVPKQLETIFPSSLTSLDLSDNRIDSLPRTFCCKMINLRVLNLSRNQLETLPIEIKFFSRLIELNMSNNSLRMLPSTFSDLRSLKTLNVANNNLSQLPAFRIDDIRLRTLDVSNNPLDGALDSSNTFEVHPSYDDTTLGYKENLLCSSTQLSKNKFQSLFEISMLNIVRCDRLLKLASDESLPSTIVSTMQRDVFKCYRCRQMNMLPAYNSTDILDYVDQVQALITTGNYSHGMTFMKLLCRSCFDKMSS